MSTPMFQHVRTLAYTYQRLTPLSRHRIIQFSYDMYQWVRWRWGGND
jgi:hypothetical protein